MSYWDNFDVNELNTIKDHLLIIINNLEIKLNIFTNLIDDINSSIDGRKY